MTKNNFEFLVSTLEDETTTSCRNFGNRLPSDATSYSIRTELPAVFVEMRSVLVSVLRIFLKLAHVQIKLWSVTGPFPVWFFGLNLTLIRSK